MRQTARASGQATRWGRVRAAEISRTGSAMQAALDEAEDLGGAWPSNCGSSSTHSNDCSSRVASIRLSAARAARELVGRRPGADAKRGRPRIVLRYRQAIEPDGQRSATLVQPWVGRPSFRGGADTAPPGNRAPLRSDAAAMPSCRSRATPAPPGPRCGRFARSQGTTGGLPSSLVLPNNLGRGCTITPAHRP